MKNKQGKTVDTITAINYFLSYGVKNTVYGVNAVQGHFDVHVDLYSY